MQVATKLFSLILSFQVARTTYTPIYSLSHDVDIEQFQVLSFPDRNTTGNCRSPVHLIGDLNFVGFGNLLVGSANVLYMLDEVSLTCRANYTWPTDSHLCNDQVNCPNYIRVYQKFPSDSRRLLVCGTQSGISPQCRTLQFSDTTLSGATDTTLASPGLISNYPELSGFGEFNDNNDTTYFSAGFHRMDSSSVTNMGGDYNITYHTVIYNGQTGTLMTSERFSAKNDTVWLSFPVTFVDYYRADYGSGFQFYFVFFREGLNGSDPLVLYSYVVRICRNDPGIDGRFSTYIKARILCEREVPPGRQFVGYVDYQYNEITSLVFNENGRYFEGGDWRKLMYGAFAGPVIGPRGTAVCVYPADNSGIESGLNRGIFEIFREDLFRPRPNNTPMEVENNYFPCGDGGRPEEASNDVQSVQVVSQIGEDPLLVLDGIVISQMALDNVCIVKRSERHQCENQDVLWLGTDSGRIMKVVFASLGIMNTLEPVVSEEISLDDNSEISDMKLRTNGSRFVVVTTRNKLYSLPVERCSRHQICRECIASRDPYCVWNSDLNACENSLLHLSAQDENSGNVPANIWQNIHTGTVSQCGAELDCLVTAIAINHQTIRCLVGCSTTAPINITTTLPSPSTSSCEANQECVEFTSEAGLGLHSYDCIVNETLSKSVTTPPGPPVQFDDSISTGCNTTACQICVQMIQLTDLFVEYEFQVYFGFNNSVEYFSISSLKRLDDSSPCIILSSLFPGETLYFIVEMHNSIAALNSSLRSVTLPEDFPGPVESITATTVTNTSIEVTWEPPLIRNGVISGYSIYINNIREIGCEARLADRHYTIQNLMPYTVYHIGVRACTSAGESRNSSELSIETLCGTSGAVVNLVAEDITYNQMTFRWRIPENFYGDSSTVTYNISATCYESSGTVIVQQVESNSFIQLSNISPRTLCCANVQAITSCDNTMLPGFPSFICEQTEDNIPGNVVNLQVLSDTISTSSFAISWDPPENYNSIPGIMYNVTVTNREDYTSLATTYFYITGLSACTLYTVSIYPYSSIPGPLSIQQINVSTLPSLPPPPINVLFSDDMPGMLTVTWVAPVELDCNYDIVTYNLEWICNGINGSQMLDSSVTSAQINIPNVADINVGWCLAQIQSCDNMRCGSFSHQVTAALPLSIPPTPRCSLFSDSTLTSNINISFQTPLLFVTDDLSVHWMLTSTDFSMNSSFIYTSSSSNLLNLPVTSNTAYNVQLRMCNVHGCGVPCSINFSTSETPSPPQNISVVSVTNTTAVIAWKEERNLLYNIAVTSSCFAQLFITNISVNHTLQNLCPNTAYTFALLAIDEQTNKRSIFSDGYNFTTNPGIPTIPRYVRGNIIDQLIVVTWIIPYQLNANISHYEIRWSFDINCTDDKVTDTETVNSDTFEFQKSLDVKPTRNLFVCVRAVTIEINFSDWGHYQNLGVVESGLASQNTDCNTLIVVACVAAITVFSSLLMSIVLSISICQNCGKQTSDYTKANI